MSALTSVDLPAVPSAETEQATVARMGRVFGALAWWGRSTGSWWALTRTRTGSGFVLVEGRGPDELEAAVIRAQGRI